MRSIHWMGHIRMMGAVQPFLSGAISKTVNLPNEATADDLKQAYVEGWRQGLKALAVYRDGSKRTQPLNTGKDEEKKAEVIDLCSRRAVRVKLPDTRESITHKFSIAGHEGYLTVGRYQDGTPGEIFLRMAKEGSTVSGLMDTIATMTSIALQYGVPLKALIDKFSHTRFEPAGFTNNPEIPMAKSVDGLRLPLPRQPLPARGSAGRRRAGDRRRGDGTRGGAARRDRRRLERIATRRRAHAPS